MIIGDGIMLGAGGESASIFVTGLSETDTVTASKNGKTVIGKWTQKPNPAFHGLPVGYTELEYIESSGTQWIDTGYKPKTNTTVKTRFYSSPYTNFDCPFGCRTSSTSYAFLLFTRYNGTAKSTFNHGNSENWIATDNMYNKWLDISTDASHLYMMENDNLLYTLTFNGTAQDTQYNLFLFNLNEAGSIYSGNVCATNCKMSYFQLYENDALIMNFIPCKRNSDDIIGMYDLITNTFFGNSGSGSFIAGPEVPQYITGFEIAPIKSYGTWTVTATSGTDTATQDVLVDAADIFSIEIILNIYTEQELLDMGVRISRTIGDQIKCNGRYIQRVETTPLAVCRGIYDTGYMGYAIISNTPVTESFIVSEYGAVVQVGGDNLTAYVYCMGSAWPTSNGYSVYLNNDVATYEFGTIGGAVDSEYVETINRIARSLPYLM